MFDFLNFRKDQSAKEETQEMDYSQALIISFDLSDEFGTKEEQKRAYKLEDEIHSLLESVEDADIDGHEFGDDEFRMYIYGSNVRSIYIKIKPLLENLTFRPVRIYMRLGEVDDPGAKEIKETII